MNGGIKNPKNSEKDTNLKERVSEELNTVAASYKSSQVKQFRLRDKVLGQQQAEGGEFHIKGEAFKF